MSDSQADCLPNTESDKPNKNARFARNMSYSPDIHDAIKNAPEIPRSLNSIEFALVKMI